MKSLWREIQILLKVCRAKLGTNLEMAACQKIFTCDFFLNYRELPLLLHNSETAFAPLAEFEFPAKVISSYLRSWADQWLETGGRLS